ncbi:Nuclear protein MDM1 [Acipenser ruthenus]|uniref:Nuclear protein MDM1 n=1 Tax=Acipenser ruthenus TaxID=7906 RepID=A0A662YS75_ACIRT|nr:Nuclear protein MDM1 [Acipenser ruthenus]
MKMPVRFKGLSEYKKNYKWKSSRSPSPEHRAPWAGLRSDQLGITKEPSFMSKKRVPHYRPQISRSFQWVHGGETPRHSAPQREAARRSVKTHAPVTEEQAAPERIRTPLGPRVPRLPRSQSVEPRPRSAPHSPLANGKSMPSLNAEKGGPAAEGNGVNRVLQKKAGLKTDMRRSVVRSSEYQRQFMWKSPSENSPLLAAEQLVYNRNKEVPPFKSGSFVRESEYQRSFKSSPPPKGLKLRKDLEEQEAENISPVSNSKNGHIDKDPQLATEKSVLKQRDSEDPQLAAEKLVLKQRDSEDPNLAAEKPVLKQQNPQRLFFPHRGYGKMKSEYNSNFRSPVKYSYKDGAWIKGLVSSDEVKELKEMAEAYKKRAQGTHFSREHLNQILSEKNRFWEVSSSSTLEESASDDIRALDLARTRVLKRRPSPGRSGSCSPVQSDTSARKSPSDDTEKASLHSGATLPVRRRLAWGDKENEHEEQETLRRREGEQAQEEKEDEQEKEGKAVGQKSSDKSGSDITPVSSNLSNEDEGRLPTPEMKNQGGAPRTHHDLTTPTVGGALLVSPPKLKASPKRDLQPEPLLGKPYSPHKYLPRETAERMSTKVDVDGPSRSSIAAGLKTSDPLPLREDSRLADSPPAALRTPSKSSNSTAPPNTGPASLSPHREAHHNLKMKWIALFALVVCCYLLPCEQARIPPHKSKEPSNSPGLDSPHPRQRINALARAAEQVCCLHVNILNFYLTRVLRTSEEQYPHKESVTQDLHRISEDHKSCANTPMIIKMKFHSILHKFKEDFEKQKKNMYRCVLKKVFEFYTAVLKIYSNPDAIGIIDRMNKSLNCTAENCTDEILACDAAILQFKKLDDAMKQVNNIEIQERAISELDRLSGCLARPKKKCI